jgi:hypothetical protein
MANNGYVALYNGKKKVIWASSLYAAKQEAISMLKIPKSKQGLLSIILAEKDGEPVTQHLE